MKQKHLAVALSAIFAAAALTGCGSDNDNNYTPPVVTPPVVTPPVTGTEDNVGDAASGITDLNKTATVGGQQYVGKCAAMPGSKAGSEENCSFC